MTMDSNQVGEGNRGPSIRTQRLTRVVQVDVLELDALEVLRLVRLVKNSFTPINRIPPEVLSHIPDYYGEDNEDDADEGLIALTHVCRGWRDTFTSRSSLWTQLQFKSVDKTLTYLQRSQTSPLDVSFGYEGFNYEAFSLMIPHIPRLKSLTIFAEVFPSVIEHFRCHTPLLEMLDIRVSPHPLKGSNTFDNTLFNGDLSSLRKLHLRGVITELPWKNLANLQVVKLDSDRQYRTTQMLDFLERAPLLHTVFLHYPMPKSSDAPRERMVPLRHLKTFTIGQQPPHSILLRHLHIPTGASLISEFWFYGDESTLVSHLPERSPNFANLSHITAINLLFGVKQKFARLSGPSGSLRVLAELGDLGVSQFNLDRKTLHSLGHSLLSTIQRLSISTYAHTRPAEVKECPIFQTLSTTDDLRTLVLIDCINLPFIFALDPENCPLNLVLCDKMEELVLYIRSPDQLHVKHLISMTRNRASRGAKLSSITIVDKSGRGRRGEASRLREHVTHVYYRIGEAPPAWDDVPGDDGE